MQAIVKWMPTHILVPDIGDTHPDHSALGLMLRLILGTLAANDREISIWNFLVHGNRADFFSRAAALRQTPKEAAAKIAAIECHKTQLKLSRRRFMAYASRPECFVAGESVIRRQQISHLRDNWKRSGEFVVAVPAAAKRFLGGAPKLFLFGHGPSGQSRCAYLPVDRRTAASLEMFDCPTDACIARVQFEGNLSAGMQIALPREIFSFDRALYLKLARRRIFFDEAGWIEVGAHADAAEAATAETAGELSLAIS
jgi:hypothetical protein